MSDEAELPPIDPRLAEFVREAIARGVPKIGHEEPLDRPPVVTGRDAAGYTSRDTVIIREVARQVITEILRDRRFLSDTEIKEVARDIAHEVFEKQIREIKDDVRTEKEIEAICLGVLRKVGLRADDEHVDETRKGVEGLLDGQKRRVQRMDDLVKETLKAFVGYSVAAVSGAALAYFAVKGVPH